MNSNIVLVFQHVPQIIACLFVCYDLRPDMFQSHELAVVFTHTIGSIYSNLCVLAVSSMH